MLISSMTNKLNLGGVSPTLISEKSMPLGVFSATYQIHVTETDQSGEWSWVNGNQ